MKKNKFSLYFVFISILTFLTIFIAIVQKSYFNLKNPQKIVEENQELNDFNPNLDLSVLSLIESKDKNINESFDFSTVKSGQSPVATPTPDSSTKSAKLIPTPTTATKAVVTPVDKTEEIAPLGELNEDTP